MPRKHNISVISSQENQIFRGTHGAGAFSNSLKKEDANAREEIFMPLPEHSAKKKKKKLPDQMQSPQRIY
jgi:hypothetical protein